LIYIFVTYAFIITALYQQLFSLISMSSFYQKRDAARKKVASGKLSKRENPLGKMVDEKPYHVMYSDGFPGYFIYMITGNHGGFDVERTHTPWGFDYYGDSDIYPDRIPPADYEHNVDMTELVAWLEKYYGDLPDVEDYQYIKTILESHIDSSGRQRDSNGNKILWSKEALAIKWLESKLEPANPSAPATLGLQWHGPRAEFVELVYALFESGSLTITQKGANGRAGAIERLGSALGVEGKDKVDSVLQVIKKRNSDRQTPLLDRLKERLLLYLAK
jgi:hypothetical protein